MIRYRLACPDAHEFEAWFASSEVFDRQIEERDVSCPLCGRSDVAKALMAPSLSTARKRESVKVAAAHPDQKKIVETLRAVRQQLTANADYVGNRFAEEARKIHYEEVEKRGIYGEATPDDVRGLHEEGIEFHPLPVLPEDGN